MKKTEISILIPTRNEVKNIGKLILEILDELKDYKIEIIVVDDSSEDGTADLVKKVTKKHREVRLIRCLSEPDLGKSILIWYSPMLCIGGRRLEGVERGN